MKRISLLLSLFALAFTACDKDQDMYKVLPADQVTAPSLKTHSAIVITLDNLKSTTTFKWNKADFGVPAAIEYTLYASNGASTPVLVSSGFGDSLDVKLEDLNKQLIQLGFQPNVTANVNFTLKASISSKYDAVTSLVLPVSITPFKPLYPDHVYMIGSEFGSWDWGSPGIAELTPVNGKEGLFWCVRYFSNPSNGFKWCTVKAWNGDFFSLGTDVGFTTHDGNAFVSAAGMYSVLIDYTINKITIEPAKVYGMGDCFGGWNTGQYPLSVVGNKMRITTTGSGELRLYANSTNSTIGGDWWRMEFVILSGQIAYRGNGGDQARVTVAAGKVVTLDFNAGTGTIQ